VDLEATVLKRDGMEVVWFIGTLLLWKKNDVGFVNRTKIDVEGVEVAETAQKRVLDKGFCRLWRIGQF
jgi:hypothetical protein